MNRNVTAVILIALAVGVYFTITKSVIAEATAIKDVNDKILDAIDKSDETKKLIEGLKISYNNISTTDREGLDKMIPTAVDNIRLIVDLNALAYRHRIVLQDIKANVPSNTPLGGGFPANKNAGSNQTASVGSGQTNMTGPILDKVAVTFNFTSEYSEAKRFLEDIEANLRVMDLTKIEIKANEGGTLDFDVEYNAYWLRQ